MSTTLQQGGNTSLTKAIAGTQIHVALDWAPQSPAGMEIDASAFCVKGDGKVRSDDDMVFYNQPRSPEGAVELLTDGRAAGGNDTKVFRLDLGRMPGAIEKVAFCVTIHEGKKRGQSFGSLSGATIRVTDAGASNTEICRFELPLAGMSETAVTFGEVYLRNNEWKFRAVGQGFQGGLGPLATSFGVDVGDDPDAGSSAPPPSPAPTPPPAPQPTPAPASAPAPSPTLNLSKITLEKKGQSISLDKKAAGFGEIRINLNWTQSSGKRKRGLFGGGNRGIDLDLGCLFELSDGYKGAIQALGDTFGAYNNEPYIELMGDDRTGAAIGGENMRVNGQRWNEIRRILVYAFIYEGVPNWAQADGTVTVEVPGEPPLEVRMDSHSGRDGMCAIAMLENVGGGIKVTKLIEYFRGHRYMDEHYRWGLRWAAGSK